MHRYSDLSFIRATKTATFQKLDSFWTSYRIFYEHEALKILNPIYVTLIIFKAVSAKKRAIHQ